MGPLSTFQRSFSSNSGPALDLSDTEMGEDEWPATQAAPLAAKRANVLQEPSRASSSKVKATIEPAFKAPLIAAKPKAQLTASGHADRSNAVWEQKRKDRLAREAKEAESKKVVSKPPRDVTPSGQPIRHKRTFPWDELSTGESTSKRLTVDAGDGKRTVHKLTSEARARSASPAPLAGPSSLNIRQKVALSEEQKHVLRMVVDEKQSVFFTGSAGTGKSVLLREIIGSLRLKHRSRADAVAVTASTGMAAVNVGGSTIHSWAGFGLGTGTVDNLVAFVKTKNKKALSRWTRTLVLIIDEVSMVDAELLDKLNEMAKKLRKSTKPFGGMQLIVTGDFFQLPPVVKGGGTPRFAFDAAAWKEAIAATVNLTQVFRQKDTQFVDMLNEMRLGCLTSKSITKFRNLSREPLYTDGIDPTELYPRREEVDRANMMRLNALRGETKVFMSSDAYNQPNDSDQQREKTLDTFMAPRRLTLKIGAQVMCLKNDADKGLVNGTTGKVVKFAPAGAGGEDDDDDLDAEEVIKATKRSATSREATPVNGIDLERKPNTSARKGTSADEIVPWVEWYLPNERKTVPEPLQREEFKIEMADGKVKASRKQFPVILSWAVSIHKSQGQTLQRVRVDLSKVFEAGQAYVALLQVLGFDDKKVRVHPRVLSWNATLSSYDRYD